MVGGSDSRYLFGDEISCNTVTGSDNCRRVTLVARPYFSNGLPDYENWGWVNGFPKCNSVSCDTHDDCGQGEICQNSLCVPEDPAEGNDLGIVVMKLLLDRHNEHGMPTGRYGQGCCCPLFLNLLKCWGGR